MSVDRFHGHSTYSCTSSRGLRHPEWPRLPQDLIRQGIELPGTRVSSFQVVQECLNTALRKALEFRSVAHDIRRYLESVLAQAPPSATAVLRLYHASLNIQSRYGFAYYGRPHRRRRARRRVRHPLQRRLAGSTTYRGFDGRWIRSEPQRRHVGRWHHPGWGTQAWHSHGASVVLRAVVDPLLDDLDVRLGEELGIVSARRRWLQPGGSVRRCRRDCRRGRAEPRHGLYRAPAIVPPLIPPAVAVPRPHR